MANLHVQRNHLLGLAEARKIAFKWAEQAENDFGMACTYEEGKTQDEVCFSRSGVHGTLHVTRDHFELDATLGFLLGAFKDKIEAEIVKNLDALLANVPAQPTRKKPAAKKSVAKKGTSKTAAQP